MGFNPSPFLFSKQKLALVLGAMLANGGFAANTYAQESSNTNSKTHKTSETIEEVIVMADFRRTALNDLAGSVDVIGQQQIEEKEARHIESLLNLIPNINFSTGASRGRYFQIRGIGERSQFVEPVNSSVGVLIDGVDMSGLGGAATLLDSQQVEVLRGPQGTFYGANALAGLIHIKSNDPTDEFTGQLAASVAEFNAVDVKAVVSGPISEQVSYRLAAQSNRSDGYMENQHLGRDDTANIDETSLRAKLRIEPSEDLQINLSAWYIDVDNGYDHFSLDNSLNTLSDEPGHDRQETAALAANVNWAVNDKARVDGTVSIADSETEYGYDEDWAFDGIHPDGYSSKDNYQRQRDSASADVRVMSEPAGRILGGHSDWLLGAYYFDQKVELDRQYTYLGADFNSVYETQRQAVYGQIDTELSDKLNLSSGLRFENHRNDYRDNSGASSTDNTEDLWGAKLSLSYELTETGTMYGLLSRGYKAGGFNTDGTLAEQFRSFEAETLWNYELGFKGMWPNSALSAQVAVFYQDRDDVQLKSSHAVARPDGSTHFVEFIDNSASGESYGLELSTQWQFSERFSSFANLGLLETELSDSAVSRESNDAAHAPSYQLAVGLNAEFDSGWYGRADVEAKDEFYFSDSHNAQSEAVVLLNATLGYRYQGWDFSVWGKNLSDEKVLSRGFGGFGNDPRNGYATNEYFQRSAPRQLGISTRYNF